MNYRPIILETIPAIIKKRTQELEDLFIEEITIEMPDWVAERKLEYLANKLKEIDSEIDWWDMLSRIYGGWFRESIRKSIVEPLRKKQDKIKREMDIYRNPILINYDKEITDSDIEQARNVNCADILEIKKKVGKRNWAICPFHPDKNPSLLCYPDGQGFYCFACKTGGDTIELVMKLYNYSFTEAVRFLNR